MMKRLAIEGAGLGAYAGTLGMNGSEELIARARLGEDEAFQSIFDRYSRPILSFIYDMIGKRDVAEELAQETFVRAYKGLGGLNDADKLSTWLFGIARNCALEHLRAHRRESNKVEMDDPLVLNLSNSEPLPEGELLNKEFNEVIRRALEALDEDKRTVFTLKVFHQRSYEEIADITGFSIPKLKTDLHRARREMRRRIRPYLGTSYEV
ncbi:MAG TPA: sigma-70 family RNA polymerase sigma factor [Pyrinomonadaceae bacterium]|nr:sigma-70 family RNA polymerase sigma factor [Pyrinomonadaceae bacterium]